MLAREIKEKFEPIIRTSNYSSLLTDALEVVESQEQPTKDDFYWLLYTISTLLVEKIQLLEDQLKKCESNEKD